MLRIFSVLLRWVIPGHVQLNIKLENHTYSWSVSEDLAVKLILLHTAPFHFLWTIEVCLSVFSLECPASLVCFITHASTKQVHSSNSPALRGMWLSRKTFTFSLPGNNCFWRAGLSPSLKNIPECIGGKAKERAPFTESFKLSSIFGLL